ncbi:type IV toxin-antitoxin system AbiEi family antitoxin domain-containing protein [Sinomonas albida]|uniref:type IV toxin-antitoxin system AbiEi family antitoxin domain-containing protein n=1 Tax=Sinomonas albida TaxID=369942 RepID=UPI003018DBD5
MGPIEIVRRRGGLARTADLYRLGVSKRELASAVERGELVRVVRGSYALPELAILLVRARAAGGRLTCISAAPFYGLWVLREPRRLHVACGNGVAAAADPGIIDHPSTHLPDDRVLPIAALADVLVHALRCLPELDALVMVQSAALRGISMDFLRKRLPGRRNGKARSVLDLVLPRADSVLEVAAALLFRRAGFAFAMHVEIEGVGEVDFVICGVLVVETDGSPHFDKKQIKKDRRRSNAAAVRGYVTLRYYWDDIVYRPHETVAEIRAVLARLMDAGQGPVPTLF